MVNKYIDGANTIHEGVPKCFIKKKKLIEKVAAQQILFVPRKCGSQIWDEKNVISSIFNNTNIKFNFKKNNFVTFNLMIKNIAWCVYNV